ncbi:MAG: hypothetical protein JWP22_2380 [Ramlibacter sp.]|jgi:hypothetical protein|nr:hypothetical protein [Ramlibacter sp.]MDB5913705.1 hypothetical protein [Ramlibacter sp.]
MFSPSRSLLSRAALLLLLAGAALGAQAADLSPADADAQAVAARGTPARVGGLWCGIGLLGEFSLEIAQRYHDFEAKLVRKGRVREITGHIEGAKLRTDPQRNETLELEALGDRLRITGGTGPLALARGQSFARATGNSCAP